jgi:formylglycine-generating enzyme
MRTNIAFLVVAALFAAVTLTIESAAQTDTFGSGSNAFTIDFVAIDNPGNAEDAATGYGSVPYQYRMSKFEVSQISITKATAGGLANVTAGPWARNFPAANINWYEAAAFVNWLNTSKGYQAAYDLTDWTMKLWSGADAWQLGGENRYRHKDAYYFLPSDNEWYKAAYYDPSGTQYFLYPTASNTRPSWGSGTNANSAMYRQTIGQGPTETTNAGGPSAYGTVGQGGNVSEWIESAYDGSNDSPAETRTLRGGWWYSRESSLSSLNRSDSSVPGDSDIYVGFRVATVPEPSTYALLIMTGAGALWWSRRKR